MPEGIHAVAMRDFRAAWLPVAALALAVSFGLASSAQDPGPGAMHAYMVRGHQAEARRRALKDRIDRFHSMLAETLARAAPDLLPALQPPPPAIYGYQLLPRIVSDPAPQPPAKPQVVSYSWVGSETLVARGMTMLDRLEAELAKIPPSPAAGARHASCETLVADYQKAVDHRRLIDADFDYNWLWQGQIAGARPLFDRITARLNTTVERQARLEPLAPETGRTPVGFDPPLFVRIDPPAGHRQVVSVPLYTDIEDAAVVGAFKNAIETHWRARGGKDEFSVSLTVEVIPPGRLYCRSLDGVNSPPTGCAPPAKGEHIDLAGHADRFPKDGAVLTTGAASLQVIGGRTIVLSPHDLAPRTMAHEFGHILGLPDAYLRGYRDLGPDGFQVLELVPDYSDIMSSPGMGSVLTRHFQGLIIAREIATEMQAGLDTLYEHNNPIEAAARFREVLRRNPDHYGATLQLAKSLDRAGRGAEALPLWEKMLAMAKAAGDAETTRLALKRLGKDP